MIVMDNIMLSDANRVIETATKQLKAIIGADVQVRFIVTETKTYIDYQTKDVAHTIIESVASYFDISIDEMIGKSRNEELNDARHIAYFLIKQYVKPILTLKQIGAFFSKRDHSTIINGLKKFNEHYNTEPQYQRKYNDIVQIVDFKLNNNKLNKNGNIS